MKIERIDPRRIMISMTENELEGYSLSFEEMSLREKRTRNVLKELMERAAERTGISFRNKKVMIEALRYNNGCVFLLTVSEKERKRRTFRIRYYSDSYVFIFDDAESLLACIRALYRMDVSRIRSTVYLYGKKYYLVLNSPTALKQKYVRTISEFAVSQKKSRIISPLLHEHGRIIALRNAIEYIGKWL